MKYASSITVPWAISNSYQEKTVAIIKPSFEEVCKCELELLYRIALKLTFNPSDAEDLVSQTLYLAAKGWAKFDGEYPRSWMIKIMNNEFRGSKRTLAGKAENEALDETVTGEHNVFDAALANITAEQVITECNKLPEEYRLAITLCDIEELSYEEAAIAMDVPMGTVRSRLFRARHILRDRLMHLVADPTV